MEKGYYWLIGFLLLLIFTNPSVKSFKEYLGRTNYFQLRRDYNFFVFSLYDYHGDQYFAIIGNFFKVPKKAKEEQRPISSVITTDTTIDNTTYLPPPPPKHKYKLWEALYNSKNYNHSFAEFEKEFSTTANVNMLYKRLYKNEYYTKSLKEFINQFFK